MFTLAIVLVSGEEHYMCVCLCVCVCVCVCIHMYIHIYIHGTTYWFQIGKECVKAVYCHPVHLTHMQSTSCKMSAWMKNKLESRLPEEIYADDTILMAQSEEVLKSLLRKMKQKSGNTGLKLNIQKTQTMTSGLITSWQINGETMEQ